MPAPPLDTPSSLPWLVLLPVCPPSRRVGVISLVVVNDIPNTVDSNATIRNSRSTLSVGGEQPRCDHNSIQFYQCFMVRACVFGLCGV